MSAVPKRNNPGFWMDAKVVELPMPEVHDPPGSDTAPASGATPEAASSVKGFTLAPLSAVFKFERAISIAIIVFALMTLSMISNHSQISRIGARDTRINIQNVNGDIGRLRLELQEAKSTLEPFDAPEGLGTLPIDPGDVAIVTIPSEGR